MSVGAELEELELNRIGSFQFASTKRQKRAAVAITEQREFKFGLRAIAGATHVAVFLVDQLTVPAHHIEPPVRRPFKRVRRQQQKIIQDRHLLLFALANDWPVVWLESQRDLKRGARTGFVLQFAFQKQIARFEPSNWFYALCRFAVRHIRFRKLRELRRWQLRQFDFFERRSVSEKDLGYSLVFSVANACHPQRIFRPDL